MPRDLNAGSAGPLDEGLPTQVPVSHYQDSTYHSKGRWVSYWQQVHEVMQLNATPCIEVGTGLGVVRYLLQQLGVSVLTVDSDRRLGPDRVGDVRCMPCRDGEAEVVLCAQVLEHLPFSDVPTALGELHRVSRSYVVLSLPQAGHQVGINMTLPFIGDVGLGAALPTLRRHQWDGQHHWVVGAPGTSRRAVRSLVAARFTIQREYALAAFPYHRFYLLHKHPARRPPRR